LHPLVHVRARQYLVLLLGIQECLYTTSAKPRTNSQVAIDKTGRFPLDKL
jgi:hypothetical protein